MSVTSLSFSSTPAGATASAVAPPLPTHPALVALRVALDAAQRLEGCLLTSSTAAAEAGDSSTSAAAAAAKRSDSFPYASFLASAYERDWELLTKQLRCMVDLTHPDGERLSSAEATTSDGGAAAAAADADWQGGRAAMLAWNVSTGVPSPAASAAAAAQPGSAGGEVMRLFSFLHRLAVDMLRSTAALVPATTAAAASSADASFTGNAAAAASAKAPGKTKAQLHAEDIVEPVLIYGCAVASNLASLVAGRKRGKRHVSGGDGGAVAGASATPDLTWSRGEAEDESLTVLGNIIWLFVLCVTRLYRTEKRMLHVLLSVLSNVVSWPALAIDADTCGFLYQLIPPFYTSYAMVAAWVTMLCNMTAVHGAAVVPALLRLGVVADVQRLGLAVPPSESATTERLVTHSVQLLSNVATYVMKDEVRAKKV